MPYADGVFVTPVPIRIPASVVPGTRSRRRRARGRPIGDYVSEYVGDVGDAGLELVGGGDFLATDYVGDHYDDVVHQLAEALPRGVVLRRRAGDPSMYVGDVGDVGDYLGFSLKPPKIIRKIGSTVVKAAKDTGKVVGKVVTSKVGKAVTGLALAATGVGVPAAAAIGAGIQAGGKAAQGARLSTIAKTGAQGAAIGAAGSLAGKAVRRVAAARRPKAIPASTSSRLDTLSREIPTVGVTPTTAVAPVIREITDAPANVLRAEDQTPVAQRRVRKEATIGDKVETAQRVLAAGTAAKATANKAAGAAESAKKKADKLAKALEYARKTGDVLGIDALSSGAAAAQNAAEAASAAATAAAEQARAVGNAAEGAAQGAIGGGILGPVGEFVRSNKGLVYGTLAGVGILLVVRSFPPRTVRAA